MQGNIESHPCIKDSWQMPLLDNDSVNANGHDRCLECLKERTWIAFKVSSFCGNEMSEKVRSYPAVDLGLVVLASTPSQVLSSIRGRSSRVQ